MPTFTPHSSIPEIVWPAVPDGFAGMVLAMQHQFAHSQWWPADFLRQQQFRQLRELLSHAARTVPFYGERLARAGIVAEHPVSEEVWARLPILERHEVQAAGEALHSVAVPKQHGKVIRASTSGSTGMPVKLLKTMLSELFWHAATIRDHHWHDRDLTGKLAIITRDYGGTAAYPKGKRSDGWGGPSSRLYRTGPTVLLDIHSTIAQQAEWLLREAPAYLLIYPTALLHLARHFSAAGLSLPSLRGVSTLGEVVTPDIRAACRAAFGVPLFDMYSSVDVGYMALQCPEHDHYHVQAESVALEVVDERGQPCRPGEIGRVVVTPLHNFAMPLIRYAVGDYAEFGGPCPCGRGLPVLARILGRTRNMLRLPSGELRWATLESERFAVIDPLVQFQVVQTSLEELEFRLVSRRPLNRAEEDKVRALLHEALGHPFAVRLAYRDAIPRSASGKFEEFMSEVGG